MKKLLSIVLSLCLLTMLLSGCGKASDDTTDTVAPDPTKSDTDVVAATQLLQKATPWNRSHLNGISMVATLPMIPLLWQR